ncbi:MAG: cohesin domain-containing protein [Saprospiraceae bacterium]
MRTIYIVLALVLAPLAAVLAQPTLQIGNGSACTGESFCVPMTVMDFTNINSLRFSINYDAEVLSFTGAQNFNAALQTPNGNLGPALFSEITPGEISFDTWQTGDCSNPSNVGVTLDDDDTLFELCFNATGTYGEQSPISLSNTPTTIRCTRNATLCNNIGIISENGEATLCVREFNITASNESGNEGDQICVDFTVTGWDALNGIQMTVNYDPSALQFVSLIPNSEIPSNTLAAYGQPTVVGPGIITVAWSYSAPQGEPDNITVADGENMFTACFNIIAPCETGTMITFSDIPTRIEANNADPDNPTESSVVPFNQTNGSILWVIVT